MRAVRWRKGRVTIEAQRHGEPIRIQAARAIVTLPLGVLQLPAASPNSVRFTPGLRTKGRALAHLATGPAIKVVMSFARPFWADLHESRYRGAAFFFAPHAPFPTFWTSLPLRTSILVAWCAGPNAERLAGKSENEITASVMDSLRAVFGRLNYSSLLEYVSWHDWQRDPFSCGAYSYVLAQGARARRSLANRWTTRCSSPGRLATRRGKPRPSVARCKAGLAQRDRCSSGRTASGGVQFAGDAEVAIRIEAFKTGVAGLSKWLYG